MRRRPTVIAGAAETTLARFVSRSLLEREGADRHKLHDPAADYARAQFHAENLRKLHLIHAMY